MPRWIGRFAFCLVLFLALPLAAQDSVELVGTGPHAITLRPDTLAVVPRQALDVSFSTSNGPFQGRYEGVLVWDVLTDRKAFEGLGHNAVLEKTFVVRGRDDYQITFSVGEIHPDFGNTEILLADRLDGKPLDGYRLVVPGDRRGARFVRDVVLIEIQ